jgi:hypothetical protein
MVTGTSRVHSSLFTPKDYNSTGTEIIVIVYCMEILRVTSMSFKIQGHYIYKDGYRY